MFNKANQPEDIKLPVEGLKLLELEKLIRNYKPPTDEDKNALTEDFEYVSPKFNFTEYKSISYLEIQKEFIKMLDDFS